MTSSANTIYKFGSFAIDESEHQVLRNGEAVALTPKVFELLLLLVRNSGRLIEKGQMIEHLWPESFVEETNLNRNISVLRKLLGPEEYIETVPKRGYRFVAPVEETVHTAPGPAVDPQGPAAAPDSLAVLPFYSLSPDMADDYLGLGVADGLISRLSNLRGIVVRPTSAILRYDNQNPETVTAGRELGVASVLEGSIRKLGDRVRVTAQLVSVSNGASIWAGTFEERFTDIFAVEDSISEKVAGALKPILTDRERSRLTRHYTSNADAYRAYLKGRYYSFKMTAEGLNKAIASFNQAIEIDPAFALAYAGLADAFTTASEWQLPPKEAMSRARSAAMKAIELDDGLAEAHAALAHVKIHIMDPSAEEEFTRAIEMNPNYPVSYLWYSEYLCMQGRTDEAITCIKKALQLDPLSPMAAFFLSFPLYLQKRFEEGAALMKELTEVYPHFWYAHWSLGGMYQMMGRLPEAIAEFTSALAIDRAPLVLASIGGAYALAGNTTEALAVLRELDEMAERTYVSPYDLAKVYLCMGNVDKTLEMLGRAFDDQSEFVIFMKVDPWLDSIRDDPRFKLLLERAERAPTSGYPA